MSNIWVTSDSHWNHQRDFIYKARGFNSVEEMNEALIENWNRVVAPDDIVYHLGDVMLGDNSRGIEYVKRLHGNIYLAAGNHDSDARIELFKTLSNIKDIQFAYRLKYHKHSLFLTHYPTITANNADDIKVYNLYGHTHQKTNFYNRCYCMYHVGVDSHNCTPVLLDDIMEEIKIQKEKRIYYE